jgi:hypothetical protein
MSAWCVPLRLPTSMISWRCASCAATALPMVPLAPMMTIFMLLPCLGLNDGASMRRFQKGINTLEFTRLPTHSLQSDVMDKLRSMEICRRRRCGQFHGRRRGLPDFARDGGQANTWKSGWARAAGAHDAAASLTEIGQQYVEQCRQILAQIAAERARKPCAPRRAAS